MMDLLVTLFDDPNRVRDAINRLYSNPQRNEPFSNWIAEIHWDAAMAGYDSQSKTLRDLVLSNINLELNQALIYHREIFQMNFDEVVSRLQDIDNRVRSFARLSAHRQLGRPNLEVFNQPNIASQGQATEPMDLSTASLQPRGPLTPEEKDRRRNLGLCIYCGKYGHVIRQCPIKPDRRPLKINSAHTQTHEPENSGNV